MTSDVMPYLFMAVIIILLDTKFNLLVSKMKLENRIKELEELE